MDDEIRARLDRDGFVTVPTDDDDEPYIITKKLIEDGRTNMLLGTTIPLAMPVRLLQGLKDEDVPWRTADRKSTRLNSSHIPTSYAAFCLKKKILLQLQPAANPQPAAQPRPRRTGPVYRGR